MKKGLALIALVVLLFAACGKEGDGEGTTLAGGDATTAPTSSSAPESAGKSAAPGASTKAGESSAKPAASSAAAPSNAPAPKAPEGGSNRPKDGAYVYAVDGTATDPFNPAAPPQKYKGEQTNTVSHSGDVYTTETTTSEQPGRTTIRTKWASDKVTMLSLKSETSGGDFSCTFNPPLTITKFPVKPETFPTQQLKGQGNACNGTLDITIVKKETTKDANGRSWSAWQVKVKLTIKSDQFTLTTNETRWVSPELGAEIRSNGAADGQFGPTKFKSTSVSALKKHP